MYDAVLECGSDADWNGKDDPNANHDEGCDIASGSNFSSSYFKVKVIVDEPMLADFVATLCTTISI